MRFIDGPAPPTITWGTTRTVIRYAYLPTRVIGAWVWLEEYMEVQRYGRYSYGETTLVGWHWFERWSKTEDWNTAKRWYLNNRKDI